MTTNELRRYFNRRKPSGGITLLIFGILFFWLGISLDGEISWLLIGLVMSGIGIFLIYKHSTKQSDAVDAFCNELADEYFDIKKIVADSKCDGIVDAVYSSGYCFENIFGSRRAICGRDKVWRSSIFEMSCMFFADDMVYYYSERVSLITDEISETQKEFRADDIRMVSLEEFNQSVVVVVTIPGNEKICISCKTKADAIELCDNIKNKTYKKEQTKC